MRSLRLAVFVSVAAFIIGGPFCVQVLGVNTRWLRGWRMYGERASDFCFVHYYQGQEHTPLSRLKLLGIEPGGPGWAEAREIRTRDQAWAEGRRLCERLVAGTPVGFSMACGEHILEQDSGNVCVD